MSAPYGGRYGDPGAIEALADSLRALANQLEMSVDPVAKSCDFDAQAFKGPLVDDWRKRGKDFADRLAASAHELRTIASYLERAANAAREAIAAQQRRDRERQTTMNRFPHQTGS